jgi:cell division protein YceG involved in septum cleavage
MSIISRTGDLFYAYRFIKLLVTDWEKTPAYELGIIDDDGKVLKKTRELKTSEEKAAYTVFHRLVFNIKRLLNKLPFGKTKLASWATALFLIKEETGMSEEEIIEILKKMDVDFDDTLFESTWYMIGEQLQPGVYTLENDIPSPKTAEMIALKGTKIQVFEDTIPEGYMIGTPIYKVLHLKTKQEIYVNPGEISR